MRVAAPHPPQLGGIQRTPSGDIQREGGSRRGHTAYRPPHTLAVAVAVALSLTLTLALALSLTLTWKVDAEEQQRIDAKKANGVDDDEGYHRRYDDDPDPDPLPLTPNP